MFIELAEYLRCPAEHAEAYCVLAADEIVDRKVVRGTIGCPTCHAEYAVRDEVAWFGEPGEVDAPAEVDPDAVAALLQLGSPGGYVALIGSAATLVEPLAGRIEGVHFVAVNGRVNRPVPPVVSHLATSATIPLRRAVVRGAVVGAESVPRFSAEAARVLLNGQQWVALADAETPPGVAFLARGDGMTVGQRSGSGA